METLKQRLLKHEGLRLRAYRDTRGFLTLGVGRNLDAHGISEEEALFMLDNDIADAKEQVAKTFPWMLGLDDVRKDVIYEMVFQLGLVGVLGFKNMLTSIRDNRWDDAAKEMLNSRWHIQTTARCEELAKIMRTGKA